MAFRRTTGLAEPELLAEYPFLPGAEALVEGFGASVGALVGDRIYEHARQLGRQRIEAAVNDPTGAPTVSELATAPREERYLSFQFARLLLSTLPQRGALRRWAVAEAKGASGRLKPGPQGDLLEVARRMGYAFEGDHDEVRVRLPDYLHLSVPIREGDFRLVGQGVEHGWVHLKPARAARLLQEGIRAALSEPLELGEEVRTMIRAQDGPFLEAVAQKAPAPSARLGSGVGPLRPQLFPPCIRKMRRILQEGENLSHSGRFALAAFLHRAGADFETIVDAYRGAPDFDEGITRYQVEHITRRADGQGYEPPECATIRAHGLCFRAGDPGAPEVHDRERDPLCFDERLRHPMQYYRWRGGVPSDRRSDPEGLATPRST